MNTQGSSSLRIDRNIIEVHERSLAAPSPSPSWHQVPSGLISWETISEYHTPIGKETAIMAHLTSCPVHPNTYTIEDLKEASNGVSVAKFWAIRI